MGHRFSWADFLASFLAPEPESQGRRLFTNKPHARLRHSLSRNVANRANFGKYIFSLTCGKLRPVPYDFFVLLQVNLAKNRCVVKSQFSWLPLRKAFAWARDAQEICGIALQWYGAPTGVFLIAIHACSPLHLLANSFLIQYCLPGLVMTRLSDLT